MIGKKYYTIREVSELLKVSMNQLRYIEKLLPSFVVTKIKGRRYYTVCNIDFLRNYRTQLEFPKLDINLDIKNSRNFQDVDLLISKFQALAFSITSYC